MARNKKQQRQEKLVRKGTWLNIAKLHGEWK